MTATRRGEIRGLYLQVLTPGATILTQLVDAVIAPLPDGWIGVLPGHTPFQARLMRGQLVFDAGNRRRVVATIGGVIVVGGDTVTVLTGAAAVDRDLEALEREIGEESAEVEEMEREAEKHFDRVYRALAGTFDRRRRFA